VNLLKRITVTAAGVAMATGLMAGAASASTSTPRPLPSVTAVTFIFSNNVPGNGGVWASDRVWRTATVTFAGFAVAPWHCGWKGPASGPPPPCFAFTATLHDKGKFVSHRGALTPNQSWPWRGHHIHGVVVGHVSGNASFGPFFATTPPRASLVPRFATNEFGSAPIWPELFFPKGTTFGVQLGPWSVTFSAWTHCGFQQWTISSSNRHGNVPSAGNITGCRH
jgi:hypothetical protein